MFSYDCFQYKIEDKIDSINELIKNSNFKNKEEVQEITYKSNEIINDIIFSMRKTKEYNFFAVFLEKIDICMDYESEFEAYCNFTGSHFLIAFNPKLIFRKNKFIIRSLIIHELYHIILNHLVRRNKYLNKIDNLTINIGMDVAINQHIPELENNPEYYNIPIIKREFNLFNVLENKNCEYYIELINQQNKKNGFKQEKKEVKFNHEKWTDKISKSFIDKKSDLIETLLNNMIKDAYSKTRGELPGGLKEIIEMTLEEPIIRWQDVLKQFIGRIPFPFKRTRTRFNRRMPDRLDLLGRISDHYFKIVIAFDTSSSLTEEQIKLCFNEAYNIISLQNKNFEITLIHCDSRIQNIQKIKRANQADFSKIHGRGGTAFSPVIEYMKDNKHLYSNSILLYFTDGFGENQLTTKPINNQILWVVLNDTKNLSLENPYGRVLLLDLEELKK